MCGGIRAKNAGKRSIGGGDASSISAMNRTDSSRVKDYLSADGAKPCVAIPGKSRHNGARGATAMSATTTPRAWTPDSWRDRPIRQVPAYPDPQKLAAMEARIGKY